MLHPSGYIEHIKSLNVKHNQQYMNVHGFLANGYIKIGNHRQKTCHLHVLAFHLKRIERL